MKKVKLNKTILTVTTNSYCVSCWDEYNQDGYSYFSTEEEAREYAESLK